MSLAWRNEGQPLGPSGHGHPGSDLSGRPRGGCLADCGIRVCRPGLGDVCIFGLRMRVAPCRVLAHNFLRCPAVCEPTLITWPVPRHRNGRNLRVSGEEPELPQPVKDLVPYPHSDAATAPRLATRNALAAGRGTDSRCPDAAAWARMTVTASCQQHRTPTASPPLALAHFGTRAEGPAMDSPATRPVAAQPLRRGLSVCSASTSTNESLAEARRRIGRTMDVFSRDVTRVTRNLDSGSRGAPRV